MSDYLGRSFAIFGLATPNFWLATIILVFPAICWAWSPPLRLVRLSADPVRHYNIFIVPGLILRHVIKNALQVPIIGGGAVAGGGVGARAAERATKALQKLERSR